MLRSLVAPQVLGDAAQIVGQACHLCSAGCHFGIQLFHLRKGGKWVVGVINAVLSASQTAAAR